MNAIEEKIEKFYEETEESVKEIIEGSDDHLDSFFYKASC
jgi:hypothetical protein